MSLITDSKLLTSLPTPFLFDRTKHLTKKQSKVGRSGCIQVETSPQCFSVPFNKLQANKKNIRSSKIPKRLRIRAAEVSS